MSDVRIFYCNLFNARSKVILIFMRFFSKCSKCIGSWKHNLKAWIQLLASEI